MDNVTWLALGVAIFGTAVSFLMTMAERRIQKYPRDTQTKTSPDSITSPGLDLDALARSGIDCLRPKTVKDEDAKARLPHLMMHNGSYCLGEVKLTLRQSSF